MAKQNIWARYRTRLVRSKEVLWIQLHPNKTGAREYLNFIKNKITRLH
jgi:hypothetical protein